MLPDSEVSVIDAAEKDIVWLFMRKDMSSAGQNVPGWGGFVSVTGSRPIQLTTIDYYPVINRPITDYSTVQECLCVAEEATKEDRQTYTISTFDLGVCMKAFALIWNDPNKYKNHIVMVGRFHLVCAYFKMVGKMAGSGLSDVLLEAGLIGSGSVHGVLSGKHYERAMHCHKIVLESLERILLDKFLEQENEDESFASLPEGTRDKINTLIFLRLDTRWTILCRMKGSSLTSGSILSSRRASEMECLGKLLSSGCLTWIISGLCYPLLEQ